VSHLAFLLFLGAVNADKPSGVTLNAES
jgi:hypothetical protein